MNSPIPPVHLVNISSCSFNRLSSRVVQPVWPPAVYTIQPFVKPVVKPVWQQVVSCKRGLNEWRTLITSNGKNKRKSTNFADLPQTNWCCSERQLRRLRRRSYSAPEIYTTCATYIHNIAESYPRHRRKTLCRAVLTWHTEPADRTPPSGRLNARGIAKYSDFGPIEGYISETVQHRS